MTNISGISVLQIIIVFAAVIATTYIANQKDKWKKLSQGIKPLLFGIAGLVIAVLMRGIIDNKINSFDSILNVILLTKQAEYMVGISRIVAISYIALLCGIESFDRLHQEKNTNKKCETSYNNRLDDRPGITLVCFGKGDCPGGSAVTLEFN
jgi:hypothetical protein